MRKKPMKTKPITPYERLLRKYGRAVSRAVFPRRVDMLYFPAASVVARNAWRIDDLAERVRAADQLGYDVRLIWRDDGLHAQYTERFVEPTE